MTAFEQAVFDSRIPDIRRLLSAGKSLIDQRLKEGDSLLWNYLESCPQVEDDTAAEVVQLLAEAGDHVNAFDGDACETPLLLATEQGLWETAIQLVHAGAKVNVTNEDYPATPLFRAQAAARRGNTAAQRCVDILKEHGAVEGCIMHTDYELFDYPEADVRLLHAVLHQDLPAAKQALADGADANRHAAWSVYPLEQALAFRSRELVQLLWQHGAKHDTLTDRFYWAVMHETEDADFIRFLLNLLTPQEQKSINLSALQTAEQQHHHTTAALLRTALEGRP